MIPTEPSRIAICPVHHVVPVYTASIGEGTFVWPKYFTFEVRILLETAYHCILISSSCFKIIFCEILNQLQIVWVPTLSSGVFDECKWCQVLTRLRLVWCSSGASGKPLLIQPSCSRKVSSNFKYLNHRYVFVVTVHLRYLTVEWRPGTRPPGLFWKRIRLD